MEISSDILNAPKEFLRLFKAGKEAARQGDSATAHEFFRAAVEVDPYHEQVWLWLASVVETHEDRRVCFENVLELNPSNPTARRQLQQLERTVLEEARKAEIARQKRSARLRWLLLIVALIAVAAGIGLGLAVGFV